MQHKKWHMASQRYENPLFRCKIKITSAELFKLILKNVNMRDFFGEYKVRAENVAGECQSTCTVHINQPSMTNEKVDNVFSRAVRKAQRVQFGTVLIDLP